ACQALRELTQTAADTATALAVAREALHELGLSAGSLPAEARVIEQAPAPATVLIRGYREADPAPVVRPAPAHAEVIPADVPAAERDAMTAAASATQRLTLAGRRLAEARRLAESHQRVLLADSEAEQQRAAAEEDARSADELAAERDTAA